MELEQEAGTLVCSAVSSVTDAAAASHLVEQPPVNDDPSLSPRTPPTSNQQQPEHACPSLSQAPSEHEQASEANITTCSVNMLTQDAEPNHTLSTSGKFEVTLYKDKYFKECHFHELS